MNHTLIWCDFSNILHFVVDFHRVFIKAAILPKSEGFIHYPKGFSKSFQIFSFETWTGSFSSSAVRWLNCRILQL